MSDQKRPNIILISGDQHRADCFGFEGRKIKTPHFDMMAQNGTVFSNCITPCVVCQPARGSILTGQLPRTHGLHDNGMDIDPAIAEKGFAGSMADAGYQTAFFGKGHFVRCIGVENGFPENQVSSKDFGEDWFGPYMGFQHVEMMILGHNWFEVAKPPHGLHYERFYHARGNGDELTKLYWENGGDTKGAAQTWHSQLPEAFHNSPWTADRAIDWIKFKRDEDKPFVTWISFPDPHHPFDCPEPWSRLHDPAEVDLPKVRERDLDSRPWWHRASLENEPGGDAENVKIRKEYSRIVEQTDEQLREIIANTYGQISLMDHQIGRIKNALVETGLDENTYVIYISDHGDWLGDHGLILKGPMHYEGLLRVPMIVTGPGVPKGETVTSPVSTLDLTATMCDLGSVQPHLKQHGQSLRPFLEGADETREFALNEWYLSPNRAGVGLALRTVRTETMKLTVDEISGVGEMYDLAADPDEMVNLFDDPQRQGEKNKLLAYLATRPDDMLPLRESSGGG